MTNPTSWVGLIALAVHVVDRLVGQWLARRDSAPQQQPPCQGPTTLAAVEQWAREQGLVPRDP